MYLKNEAKFRSQLLSWLTGLTEKQFAEFFYEAFRKRKTGDGNGHFVLANATLQDGDWTVDVIALPDPAHNPHPWIDDAPICQHGECMPCKATTYSWAKHALCPICGQQVYGT